MTNRFGFDLYAKEVRWAAAEGVTEDVIMACPAARDRNGSVETRRSHGRVATWAARAAFGSQWC
jgi:hypothetical protein